MTIEQANDEGYRECRHVPGRGLCGIMRMAFTVGLFWDLEDNPFYNAYSGRYCYPNYNDASNALASWTGEGDPPDGDWIKHKGTAGEWSNPNNEQTQYLIP